MQEKTGILIIDDKADSLEMFSRYLSEAGYAVTVSDNEQEGFEIISEGKADCVLLSYQLARMSDFEIVKKIQSESVLELAPAIILTGLMKEEDILTGLGSGVDDYISKPSSLEIILTKVKAVLRTKYLKDAVIRLNRSASELKDISIKDGLTGLYNRRYLQESLDMEISRAKRCKYNICCLMIDIDYFKLVNDNHGHAFGDFVLKDFGDCIKICSRESDVLARYGGDEFIVIAIDTDYAVALNIAERFRKYVEKHDFTDKGVSFKLTVSIGISSLLEDGVLNKDKFLSFADRACYEAKARGRNNSVTYRELVDLAGSDKAGMLETENKIYNIAEYSKKSYIDSIKGLIFAWEERNPFTAKHSENVVKYVQLITAEMNLPKNEIEVIENAAAIHDLGKLLISENILFKKDELSPQEWEIIKKHPSLAVNLLSNNRFMKMELPIILYHHEQYDGNGYPVGLAGKRIPLGSRIIRVADAYDSICSGQPQCGGAGVCKETINELLDGAGTQFDPEIVDIFLKALQKNGG